MSADYAAWNRPALLDQVLHARRDGRAEVALHVPALDDPRRTVDLQQYLESLRGVVRVRVDVHARRLRITFDPRAVDLPRLLQACAACACPARPLRRECLDVPELRAANDSLKRLAVAGLFMMQAMMFALVLYLGVIDAVNASTLALFRWLEMLAAVPVIGYAAVPFFRRAWADLRAGRAGIDVPIALAVILICAASAWNTLRGHGHIWFDSASMLVFALLLGRHLELRARCRHQSVNAAASDAMPLLATRRADNGPFETVAAMELVAGDIVRVSEGSVIPADGILKSDHARLDASHQDGESRVRTAARGDAIHAGGVALDSPIELTVTRAGSQTRMMRAHQLADGAAHQRARSDSSGVGVGRFVAGVLGLAAATGVFWLWHDPTRAFDTVVAVLVVACPCAFALAMPATLTRAMTVLSRHGVIVTRPHALAALARADHAVFDKTGTLTRAHLDANNIDTFGRMTREQALQLAGALASGSSHPLSQAIVRASRGHVTANADHVEAMAGNGLRGQFRGRTVTLGRAGFANPGHDDDDALWLADDHGPLARFHLTEALRDNAHDTIRALRIQSIGIDLASGDHADRVAAVAHRVGIEHWQARQLPRDKYELVRRRQHDGHRVLVVGDGSNDAAALATADVSASIDGATDLARRHADILLGHDIGHLLLTRALARDAMRIVRQNRRWGLAWNIAAIPLAACGLVSPWLAALGMSFSSLVVVLNALRLGDPALAVEPPRHTSNMEGHTA
ncbi:MAG TPA: heavy metal translocating P-type ATPase [Oleiagrimonas sp.]|nr:heavy metal translocating P-type ATPase [Oleiagrimonas sp.]